MVTGKFTLPEDVIAVAVGEPMLTTGAVRSAVPESVPVLVLPAVSVTVALIANVPPVYTCTVGVAVPLAFNVPVAPLFTSQFEVQLKV